MQYQSQAAPNFDQSAHQRKTSPFNVKKNGAAPSGFKAAQTVVTKTSAANALLLTGPSLKQDSLMNTTSNNTCAFTTLHHQQANGFPQDLDDLRYGETQAHLIRHQEEHPQLYKRGPTKYQKSQNTDGMRGKVKGHWTEEEDKKLEEAVRVNGGKNWKKIAEAL